jgi:DNA-binding protein
VGALLEDVRQLGPVHLRGLGIIGRHVFPAYNGRNPRTGEVIVVPEKSMFTCLVDEALERTGARGLALRPRAPVNGVGYGAGGVPIGCPFHKALRLALPLFHSPA